MRNGFGFGCKPILANDDFGDVEFMFSSSELSLVNSLGSVLLSAFLWSIHDENGILITKSLHQHNNDEGKQ